MTAHAPASNVVQLVQPQGHDYRPSGVASRWAERDPVALTLESLGRDWRRDVGPRPGVAELRHSPSGLWFEAFTAPAEFEAPKSRRALVRRALDKAVSAGLRSRVLVWYAEASRPPYDITVQVLPAGDPDGGVARAVVSVFPGCGR